MNTSSKFSSHDSDRQHRVFSPLISTWIKNGVVASSLCAIHHRRNRSRSYQLLHGDLGRGHPPWGAHFGLEPLASGGAGNPEVMTEPARPG